MASPVFSARTLIAVSALLSVFWVAHPAWGWVDKTYESDNVTLDVERDGTAVVTHEILLAMRGGPLPEFSFEPVDTDAELLPEATVTSAKSGVAAGYAIPLSAAKDGARAVLHVLEGKGLRSGKFLIRFRYRTSLATTGKIQPGTSMSRIDWTGLAFPNGMDAAKVVFRLPRGLLAPRLHATDSPSETPGDVADDGTGVFLGTLRRGSERDEFEIVRPHVAKTESVRWSLFADRGAFELPAPEVAPAVTEPGPETVVPVAAPRRVGRQTTPFWIAGIASVLYGLALFGKSRAVTAGCRARRVTPRTLVPLSLPFRMALSVLGVGAAVLMTALSPEPELSASCLLMAIACSTYLPSRANAALRGPGKWVRLDDEALFAEDSFVGSSWTRLSDAGTVLGFLLFMALLAGFALVSVSVMRHSPYQGLAVALGSAVLFPLFFTGRRSDLPPDPAHAPAPLLDFVAEACERNPALETHPLGRIPLGADKHDELRLLVVPKPAMQGLVAIEVGVEHRATALSVLGLPFVLVRVLEGSRAADALPKGLLWTRGRSPDERVAVLRPRVPLRRATVELVQDVARRFATREDGPRAQSETRASSTSGKGSKTVKAGTSASPAHAT